jgi:uncharacterized membrane protein
VKKSPPSTGAGRPPVSGPSHHDWRTRFRRTLIAGLLILAPLALTVYVLVQLFQVMDGIFAPLVDRVLSTALQREEIHIPGLGLLLTFCVIMVLGWLSTDVGGRRILHAFEGVVRRIPVAKSIYAATKGVLEAVSQDKTEAFKRVVLIEYPKASIYALAFVTGNARWSAVEPRFGDLLTVFVPTTPNPTSGCLLLVPRAEAIDLQISVEEGVRMVISGGILLPQTPLDRPPLDRPPADRPPRPRELARPPTARASR